MKKLSSEKHSSLVLPSISCDGFAFLVGLVLVGIEALFHI